MSDHQHSVGTPYACCVEALLLRAWQVLPQGASLEELAAVGARAVRFAYLLPRFDAAVVAILRNFTQRKVPGRIFERGICPICRQGPKRLPYWIYEDQHCCDRCYRLLRPAPRRNLTNLPT